jgi:hypothetical protein
LAPSFAKRRWHFAISSMSATTCAGEGRGGEAEQHGQHERLSMGHDVLPPGDCHPDPALGNGKMQR